MRACSVEIDAAGNALHINYAPYLDYRPLAEGEPGIDALLARPECTWIGRDLEQKAQGYAISHVVPEHLDEVRSRKLNLIYRDHQRLRRRRRAVRRVKELCRLVGIELNSDTVLVPKTLLDSAEPLERFKEESLDVAGLEPTSFGALHVLTEALNAASIHREKRMEEMKLERQIVLPQEKESRCHGGDVTGDVSRSTRS